MINSTDGWAVGSDGVIIHWDGTSWNNMTSLTGGWLKVVDMISSTDGWILADNGDIYHLQEDTPDFPIIYPIIIIGVAAVVLAVWLFLRYARKKSL
jgi:hypothetical protein